MVKKQNSKKKIAIIALLGIATLSTAFISSTYAKYTSSEKGTDAARVAKWDVQINDTTLTQFKTINLFDTEYESKADSSTNSVVSTEKVVAPGTSGEFEFEIFNNSEVSANYTISLKETNSENIPIEYSLDGLAFSKTDEDGKIDLGASASSLLDIGDTSTITIYWRWKFEDSTDENRDTNDTVLGKDGTAVVEVTAEVTATQVD